MRRAAVALLAVLFVGLSETAASEQSPAWAADDTIALENGRWFDGARFRQRRAVYIVGGRLESRRPSRIDRRVDLSGAYVVPPLGDAHTHRYDGPFGFPAQRQADLTDGVFYAMTMTAPARGVARIRDQFSGPTNVDVRSALGGITGPDSHPAEIYEAVALGFYTFEQQLANQAQIRESRRANGNAYHIVSNIEDLDRSWAALMAQQPDLVKVFLRSSERYEEGWGKWGPGGGLDPNLLPAVAERARAEGLRLAVSASSISDFRAALAVDADMVTHLPCYQDTESGGVDNPYYDLPSDEECRLTSADARAAARQGVVSLLITSEWDKPREERAQRYRDFENWNVSQLERAGAALAIGSNAYGETVLPGLIALSNTTLFSRARLLRLATMDTPNAIFPERAIGCMRRGCEASFLVLNADPLQSFEALRDIRFRVKEGLLLSYAAISGASPAPR
jgi:imidazolonepropionase-like amidohydrolase